MGYVLGKLSGVKGNGAVEQTGGGCHISEGLGEPSGTVADLSEKGWRWSFLEPKRQIYMADVQSCDTG